MYPPHFTSPRKSIVFSPNLEMWPLEVLGVGAAAAFYPCRIHRVPACLAGVTAGVFTCVGWQVTLCDPTHPVALRSWDDLLIISIVIIIIIILLLRRAISFNLLTSPLGYQPVSIKAHGAGYMPSHCLTWESGRRLRKGVVMAHRIPDESTSFRAWFTGGENNPINIGGPESGRIVRTTVVRCDRRPSRSVQTAGVSSRIIACSRLSLLVDHPRTYTYL